jgi:GNAT superfamily N-acetyltransferase
MMAGMEVEIRPRADADLDACVAALRAVHEADDYPLNWPADPRRWLTPGGLAQAWVALLSGAVAGHVLVLEPGEVARLFVTPAAQRRSVGSALLAAAGEWAAARERPLTLTVTDTGRSGAVALYEAAGWQHTRTTIADWTAPDGSPVRLRHYRR